MYNFELAVHATIATKFSVETLGGKPAILLQPVKNCFITPHFIIRLKCWLFDRISRNAVHSVQARDIVSLFTFGEMSTWDCSEQFHLLGASYYVLQELFGDDRHRRLLVSFRGDIDEADPFLMNPRDAPSTARAKGMGPIGRNLVRGDFKCIVGICSVKYSTVFFAGIIPRIFIINLITAEGIS